MQNRGRPERQEVAPINRAFAPERPAATKASPANPPAEHPLESPATSAGTQPKSPDGGPAAATEEERWLEAVNAVRASSPRLGTSLAFGRLVKLDSAELVLAFSKQSAFHKTIVAGSGRTQLEQMLSAHLQRPIRLRIEEATANAVVPLSPAEREAQQKDARDRELEAKMRSHAAVQAALRVLGGEIEQIQLLESERSAPSPDTSDETS
jgi:hypothetical protein